MKSDFKRCFQLNLWVHASPRSLKRKEHQKFGPLQIIRFDVNDSTSLKLNPRMPEPMLCLCSSHKTRVGVYRDRPNVLFDMLHRMIEPCRRDGGASCDGLLHAPNRVSNASSSDFVDEIDLDKLRAF